MLTNESDAGFDNGSCSSRAEILVHHQKFGSCRLPQFWRNPNLFAANRRPRNEFQDDPVYFEPFLQSHDLGPDPKHRSARVAKPKNPEGPKTRHIFDAEPLKSRLKKRWECVPTGG
ncbi:hypothetical protein ACPWT1_08105 [Ramlibacter sp. MMS24-I3-19]|uniref:hypothetical protein n=1 Tax=Ramlibacter sp. MMS24-I3-19 TaxID=3416606 RepID=UPI003D05F698